MKKIISLILCLLIAASALAACSETGDNNVSGAQSEIQDESSDETTAEESSEVDHLANPDIYKGSEYNGRKLTFLTFGVGADHVSEFMFNDGLAEEKIPATVNEAIRSRNNNVSQALGVTIEEIYYKSTARYGGDSLTKIRTYISTADSETFQVMSICLYDCGTLALENNLYDLNTLENINMENPWWEQSFNDSVTIAGQLYFTLGDIGINHKDATPCVYYNTRLMQDLQLADPIDLAENGQWTIDTALQYSKALCIDSADPEGMDYLDEFGWAGQYDDMYAMLYGAGVKILSPDADGFPSLTLNTPTAVGTVDKVLNLMLDKSYMSGNDYFDVSPTPMELLRTSFQEGRCLFYSGGVNSASVFEMDDIFGILPVPKYSVDQDNYYSLINTWVTNAYCIGANCDEETAEFAAAVLDVMGYYSWSGYPDSLSYNYYEKMLKAQKLNREDSEAMLDLIFAARGCELGAIFQVGKMQSGTVAVNTMLGNLIAGGVIGTFTSTYEKYADIFQSDVEFLNEHFISNE